MGLAFYVKPKALVSHMYYVNTWDNGWFRTPCFVLPLLLVVLFFFLNLIQIHLVPPL